MSVKVKICGITDEAGLEAAVLSGADMVGFVFFPASPRFITPERAAELIDMIDPESDVQVVGLFVDADDAMLSGVLPYVRLDMIQCHGKESPERVDAIRQDWALPVIKAIPVSTPEDLAAVDPYLGVADSLLFDAKPPKGAVLPGGNALSFDWTILSGKKWGMPWLLAGGLDPANVAEAIRISGADAVDVSSGVESAPGKKDPARIKAFIEAAKSIR
jgi:phosphoribosylanthranilate isomerase